MKHKGLRRLAIQLAITKLPKGSSCWHCGRHRWTKGVIEHTPNCPIAELEAEEAADATKPKGKFRGEF